ncbi:unnamed protein product [Arabidopsis lyrata]|nr:unnamed protein product [Arabidopsis lyrata]
MKFLQRSSAYFGVGIDHLLHALDPLCKTLAELCGRNYRQCWLLQKHNQFIQILRTRFIQQTLTSDYH